MIGTLEIATIREMFPDDELYYIKVADREFICKTISPHEYATIKQIAHSPYDEQDLVSQTAIIYPSNYNVLEGEAGVPKAISDLILKFSLLHKESKPEIIDRFKAYAEAMETDIDEQIPVVIKMAFPEFTFEQIEQWTLDTKLKNLSRAIFALKLKGIVGLQGYEINEEALQEDTRTYEEREQELWDNGYDPIVILHEEYKTRPALVEFPFLFGPNWDNEEIIDGVQRQLQRR